MTSLFTPDMKHVIYLHRHMFVYKHMKIEDHLIRKIAYIFFSVLQVREILIIKILQFTVAFQD